MRVNEALTSPVARFLKLGIAIEWFPYEDSQILPETLQPTGEERSLMDASRKPLAKVEGRRRMPLRRHSG
jgi:hypothetical protein